MRVVLDSTTFIADLQLKGTSFRVLRDALAKAGYTLHVPAVVVEEVKNQYRERLRKAVDDVVSKHDALGRLGVVAKPPTFDDSWFNEQCDLFGDHLKRWLRDGGAELLPVPSVSHESLIERDLQRRKPFSENGAGYRDALIWESVRGLAETAGDDVLVVTGNKHDFSGTDGSLHDDLKDDLSARGQSRQRVTLVLGLDTLVDTFIKPDLERLDAIRVQLIARKFGPLDIEATLNTFVPLLISEKDWGSRDLGLPSAAETPTVIYVDDHVDEIEVTDVLKLPTGELLIEADAVAQCSIEFLMYRSNITNIESDTTYSIDDANWDEHFVSASAERRVRAYVRLTFDVDAVDVTSADIEYVEPVA